MIYVFIYMYWFGAPYKLTIVITVAASIHTEAVGVTSRKLRKHYVSVVTVMVGNVIAVPASIPAGVGHAAIVIRITMSFIFTSNPTR